MLFQSKLHIDVLLPTTTCDMKISRCDAKNANFQLVDLLGFFRVCWPTLRKMSVYTIVMIRHGESEWNKVIRGVCSSSANDLGLKILAAKKCCHFIQCFGSVIVLTDPDLYPPDPFPLFL